MFLAFIDEGAYNFRWMSSIGNWIMLFIYALAIFLSQLLIFKVVLRKDKGAGKTLISIIVGAIIGVTFVIGMIYAIR